MESFKTSAVEADWPAPYRTLELRPKQTRFAFLVVALNEGDRLRDQLRRMEPRADLADVVIADGDSTDGSTDPEFLRAQRVRSLLVTAEPGLGTALAMGFHYVLEQGYDGVVTVDGNGKDGVEALPQFLNLLEEGVDFVQGSRFMPGGRHENTPFARLLGVRLIVAPLLFLAGGKWYSDPTNGFKGFSRRYLSDPHVRPLRRELARFSMQFYLNCRAPSLGFRTAETPVSRSYPSDGTVPTKITSTRTKLVLLRELAATALGVYSPKRPR